MKRVDKEEEEDCLVINSGSPNVKETVLSGNFVLDHVGEVFLTLDSDCLSWTRVDSIFNVRFLTIIGFILCLFCSFSNFIS